MLNSGRRTKIQLLLTEVKDRSHPKEGSPVDLPTPESDNYESIGGGMDVGKNLGRK